MFVFFSGQFIHFNPSRPRQHSCVVQAVLEALLEQQAFVFVVVGVAAAAAALPV